MDAARIAKPATATATKTLSPIAAVPLLASIREWPRLGESGEMTFDLSLTLGSGMRGGAKIALVPSENLVRRRNH